jgi:hypothetical protein
MILISGATPEVDLPIALRSRIEERMAFMAQGEPFDPDLHGLIVVVESGDSLDALSSVIGFDILISSFTGLRFGEPGFEPTFEVLEESPACYELVFIHGDGDDGIVIFIPKGVEIDPELLAYCQTYATAAPGVDTP